MSARPPRRRWREPEARRVLDVDERRARVDDRPAGRRLVTTANGATAVARPAPDLASFVDACAPSSCALISATCWRACSASASEIAFCAASASVRFKLSWASARFASAAFTPDSAWPTCATARELSRNARTCPSATLSPTPTPIRTRRPWVSKPTSASRHGLSVPVRSTRGTQVVGAGRAVFCGSLSFCFSSAATRASASVSFLATACLTRTPRRPRKPTATPSAITRPTRVPRFVVIGDFEGVGIALVDSGP